MHMCVCVSVCPSPRPLITSGVMWHDDFCIAAVISIISGCVLSIHILEIVSTLTFLYSLANQTHLKYICV